MNVLMKKMEKEAFAEATKRGLLNQALKGFYPRKPPLGYKSIYRDRQSIERVIDTEIGGQLEAIFSEFSITNLTFTEFIRQLKNNPAYKELALLSVKRLRLIFSNPFYCGDFIWGGKVYRGVHPALISKETWLSVIRKLHPKREL